METPQLLNKPGKILNTNPEKITSFLTGAGLLFGVGYGLYYLLPYVKTILENLIYTLALGTGLAVTVGVILHNRKMIWVAYQLFIQKLWRALANSDPIGIMKIGLRKWREKHEEVNEQITALESAKAELEKVMEQNKDQANTSFSKAQKAKEMGLGDQANFNAVRAKRRVVSNEQLIPRLNAVNSALEFLKKLYERWGYDIELLKEDIDTKERDLKLVKTTASALRSAYSLISGDPDDLALQELSNQAYAEQVSRSVGYITRFMDQGKQWMYDSDIREAILSDEGGKLLEGYNEDTFEELTNFRKKVEMLPVATGKQIVGEADKTMSAFKDLH